MARRRVLLAAFLLLLSTAHAKVHNVRVDDRFSPETLTAEEGDVISYSFHAGNHSVIQTSLESPCAPLDGGFSSGFVATEGGSPVTFRVVADGAPVYVYSGDGDSCSRGMLQVINPPSEGGGSLENFKKAAGNTTTRPETDEPVGGQRVLTIDVGKDGSHFSPSDAGSQVPGTILRFHFHPKNNSVVQALFDEPCQPLEGGFAAGFIPIDSESAGVDFSVVLNDTEPVYFYDALRCQSGMVGSINAPSDGETQDSFASKARQTKQTTHPKYAPQGGTLTANATTIPSLNGAVLHISLLNSSLLSTVPDGPPDPSIIRLAGGAPPSFAYGGSLSDETATRLQLLQFADNILLATLADGTGRLATGEWSGVFPHTITHALEAAAAQSYIHRGVSATPLRHFNRPVPLPCAYTLPLAGVDDFVSTALALLLLEVGLYGGVVRGGAESWVVPAVAGALGTKARTAGLLDMMQNRTVGAAPGEVPLPPGLAYSFLDRYVGFCPDGDEGAGALAEKFDVIPGLRVSGKEATPDGGRVTKVAVQYSGEGKHVAWVGGFGEVEFTDLDGDVAAVPADMYGHVWAVVTKEKDVRFEGLEGAAVAGPELVWLGQP